MMQAHPIAQLVLNSDNAFILICEGSALITSLMEHRTGEIQGGHAELLLQ